MFGLEPTSQDWLGDPCLPIYGDRKENKYKNNQWLMADVGGNNVHLVSHVLPTLMHYCTRRLIRQCPFCYPPNPLAMTFCFGDNCNVGKHTVEKSHTTGRLIRHPQLPTLLLYVGWQKQSLDGATSVLTMWSHIYGHIYGVIRKLFTPVSTSTSIP